MGPGQGLIAVIKCIEGLAGSFHTHKGAYGVNPAVHQCLQKNQGLYDTLHGKKVHTIAGKMLGSIREGNINTNPVGIHVGQFRYIGCNMSLRCVWCTISKDLL